MALPLILSVLLFSLYVLPTPSMGDVPLVQTLCTQTRNKDLCTEVLLGDGQTSACTDTRCVALGMTQDTSRTAKQIQAFISSHLPSAPEFMVPLLQACHSLYITAEGQTNQSVKDLTNGYYLDAVNALAAAEESIKTCAMRFGPDPNPMTGVNQRFEGMCEIGLDLVNYLRTHPNK